MESNRQGKKQGEKGFEGKSSKWWWFIVQCETEEQAKTWELSEKPKYKYAIWRAHAAPTTGKPHVHCLVNYCSAQRYSTLKNKGYNNLVFCNTRAYQEHNRNYVKTDTHKDGTPKNPIGPYVENGEWEEKNKQGERNDLINAKKIIESKKRWREVLHDDELVHVVAKYGKWAKELYDNRPQEIPEVVLEKGLQPYQIKALEYFDEKPKDRRIIWIWSHESGTGKSKFYSYCCRKYYVLDAKSLDDREILASYDRHDIIWFDFMRKNVAKNEKFENLRNAVIESFSNIQPRMSTKYHPVEKFINSHIVVTSNDPPPYNELPDRIVEIYAPPLQDMTQVNEEQQEREEGQRLLDERAQQCIEYGLEEEPQEITDLLLFKKKKNK